MNIRSERQEEAKEAFLSGSRKSIILAAPRIGKCRLTLNIIKELGIKNVLICYPRHDIKKSWEDEMNEIDFHPNVKYSTYASLHHVNEEFSFVVYDEVHEASYNQLLQVDRIMEHATFCLGLTGTMTQGTRNQINRLTGLGVCWEYPLETAIEDGILCDYQIWVHRVNMWPGEEQKFRSQLRLREKLKEEGKKYKFVDLRLSSLIQKSPSKLKRTKELITDYYQERLLVFCGLTEIADALSIPAYHSKAKDRELLESFCTGKGNHLVTINMVQSGITIKPISKGIINYISGAPEATTQKLCRYLTYEYNNPDKKADLHIVTTTQSFELERLKTALTWFDKNKIFGLLDNLA